MSAERTISYTLLSLNRQNRIMCMSAVKLNIKFCWKKKYAIISKKPKSDNQYTKMEVCIFYLIKDYVLRQIVLD